MFWSQIAQIDHKKLKTSKMLLTSKVFSDFHLRLENFGDIKDSKPCSWYNRVRNLLFKVNIELFMDDSFLSMLKNM